MNFHKVNTGQSYVSGILIPNGDNILADNVGFFR